MLITSLDRILVVNKVRERNKISSRHLLIEKEQENTEGGRDRKSQQCAKSKRKDGVHF
jgi:hypothetical protein